MQASRILRSSSAARGFLIPPRTSWDIFKSAANACLTIVTSREKRDDFVATLNKGIISPEVLQQADHGPAMILALYNDLSSPYFSKYGLEFEDFKEGVKPALEQFHDVQCNLENILYIKNKDEAGEKREEKESIEQPVDEKTPEKAPEGEKDSQDVSPDVPDEIAAATKAALATKSWQKEAEEHPDSLAAQLSGMVSPEFFELLEGYAKTGYMLGDNFFAYEDGSSEINNVALLSARAMVMESSEGDADRRIEDDELNVKEGDEDTLAKKLPIAAQIEVLYDIKQKFTVKEESTGDDKEAKESETVTKSNVWVGVFEGWLNGNPDGSSDLRWKLVLNRNAWEFPTLSGYYQ